MKKIFPPINAASVTGYLLTLLFLIRAFFNGVLPLMDKTEARYAEIARLMAETGEWIVLQIDYGIPFWAKPPLSTWFSAACISLFGEGEFFVRLPYLLACLAMVFLVGKYRPSNKMSFYLPGLILMSLPEFYLHAGVVSTDTFLCLSIALVMLSFWEGIQDTARVYWRYLLFVGMGLGLLAKGPIVGVLTVPPILLWCALSDFKWRTLLRFPIVLGALISLGIAVPWYIWAEMRSPGFVDYFIVGEHFKRYLDSSWSGDKYGFPKQQPLGMVWLFLIGAVLPWIGSFIKKIKAQGRGLLKDQWSLYLLLWLLWTPLFFSSSKSLIHPYTLPVMIPFALLIVHYWEGFKLKKIHMILSLELPLLLVVIYFSGAVDQVLLDNSDKTLVASAPKTTALYALDWKSYSSQYYSQGKIEAVPANTLLQQLRKKEDFSVIIRQKDFEGLPLIVKDQLELFSKNKKRGIYKAVHKQYSGTATFIP